MRVLWSLMSVLSVLGYMSASSITPRTSTTTRIHPALQKRGQQKSDADKSSKIHIPFRQITNRPNPFLTTTLPPTTIQPLSEVSQTGVHSVVRVKPVYQPHHTDQELAIISGDSISDLDDENYYYTYEDISDETDRLPSTKDSFLTTAATTTTTVAPTRSYWLSHMSSDNRLQNRPQRYPSGYHRQVGGVEETRTAKSNTDYRSRGISRYTQNNNDNVNKDTKDKKVESVTKNDAATDKKNVKNSNNGLNQADLKHPVKEEQEVQDVKTTTQPSSEASGRVGEMAVQSQLSPQAQFQPSPSVDASSRSSKFDATLNNVKFVDNVGSVQQPLLPNSNPSSSFFISATPSSSNSVPATGLGANLQQNINNLSPRHGPLAFGVGMPGGYGVKIPMPGQGGHGSGFTLNLGSVPDPISLILKLLASLPKPLLNLNSRIIFGIELGNNIGLAPRAAAAAPGGKAISLKLQ